MTLEELFGRKVTSFGMELEGGYDLHYGEDYDGDRFVSLSLREGWFTTHLVSEKADTAQEALDLAVAYLNPERSRD
jgi:hypothetical protein